jgi:hypothetical protein
LTVDEEQRDPLRPLHELNPQVSPAVSAILHQAMAIRRRERPENAAEMRRLLSEASHADAFLAAEEKRRTHEVEETHRRREAAKAAPTLMPQSAANVPPTHEAAPLAGASGTPAQMKTLQTPTPAFQSADSQSLSPVGTSTHTTGRGGGKSKWRNKAW